MRRLTIALALTALVGASPVLAQTPTPTLMMKHSKHGETNFAAFEYGTFQMDPPQLLTGTNIPTLVILAGFQPGDLLVLEPPADLDIGLGYCGFNAIGNNQISVRLCNVAAGSIDDTVKTWKYLWFDRTTGPPSGLATPNSQASFTPTATNTSTATPTATPTDTPTATPTPP